MPNSANGAINISVLILEDDSAVMAILVRLLEKNYSVTCTSSLAEFKNIMPGGGFHVILLDINLPDGSGLDLCREIRNHDCCSGAFILLMTGDISHEMVEMGYDAGADDFIRKPFVLREVSSKVATYANIIRAREGMKSANEHLIRANREYRDEIDQIRKIQVSQFPDFSRVDNYKLAISYLPAAELSGDFMDGFFVDEWTYQLVICDISGHGMASSYVGTEVRTLFRVFSTPERSLPEIVAMVNETMILDFKGLYFYGTAIACRLDTRSGRVRLLNAGHPDALLVRGDGSGFGVFESTGPLLGFFPNSVFIEREIDLQSQDLLFLYTDGLTEAHGGDIPGINMFGTDRLKDILLTNSHHEPVELTHLAISAMYEFTDYHPIFDDVTAICIKKK